MATLVLSVGGSVLGNMLLPGLGGAIGGALGAYVGGMVDQQLFGEKTPNQTVYGARLQDLRVQSSAAARRRRPMPWPRSPASTQSLST